jgi:hypothetical protein
LVEEVPLLELQLLLVARQQEEHLGLEGVALRVGYRTPAGRGSALDLFEDGQRARPGAWPSNLGERRLADADGAFDGDQARGGSPFFFRRTIRKPDSN